MKPSKYFRLILVLGTILTLASLTSGATDSSLFDSINVQARTTLDISGKWTCSTGIIYQITQRGNSFSLIDTTRNIIASGRIRGEQLTATWMENRTRQSFTGRITEFDSSGRPTQIVWSNETVFSRESKPQVLSPIKGWCCKDGNVFATTITECNKQGGKFFKKREHAEEVCQKEYPQEGWCCLEGQVFPSTRDVCLEKGGHFFPTQEQAEHYCQENYREPDQGFCCIEGKIFPASIDECLEKGGHFFPTREQAEESCRVDINLKPNEVRPFEKDDFAITSITCQPVYPQPGEQTAIRIAVLNRSEDYTNSLKVALLINGRLKEIRKVDIQGRSSSLCHFNWRPNQAGVYNLRAVVDPDEDNEEVSRHDNSLADEIVVSERPSRGSNFEIIDLRWKGQENKPIPQITVRNNGNTKARIPVVLRDEKGKISRLLVGPIEPGDQITVDGPLIVEKLAGKIMAEVNPRFRNDESDPADNLKGMRFHIIGDLTVEKLTFHERKEGSKFSNLLTVSFRLVNQGAGDVLSVIQTSIRLKGNGTSDSYTLNSPGLDAGDTLYVSRSFKRPSGAFDVEVEVDSGRTIPESSEGNNTAKWHFKGSTSDPGRWVSIGPRRIKAIGQLDAIGRTYHTVVDPKNRSTIYIGVPSPYGDKTGSGIWKTTDGGINWYPVSDSFESCAIWALAIDKTHTSRLYALTPDGLYRTDDGGTSWKRIYTNALRLGTKLIVNSKKPNRLISMSSQGIFLSTNSGKNWISILSGGAGDDIVEDPDNPNRLYAALYHETNFQNAGIYESISGGDNWRKISGCPGGKLPEIKESTGLSLGASKNTLYVGYKKKGKFELYRTTDLPCKVGSFYEKTWEAAWSTTDPISEIEADPKNPKYLIAHFAGALFYLSTNGGESFSKIKGKHPHVDQHGVFYDPVDTQIVYIVNDGGIYRSDDHGKENSWAFIGEGICNIEFFDIAISKTDPSLVIGGTQDNGTIRYEGKNTYWQEFHGGDGGTCAIDPTNSAIQYLINQYPTSLSYLDESGKHGIGSGLPEGDVFGNMYYQLHPGKPDILLACAGDLYRRDNARSSSASWKKIFIPSQDDGNVRRVAVDATEDLYYVGFIWGRLYAGPDGKQWAEVFRHPLAHPINDIEIDPNKPKNVYLACGGWNGNGRIYRLYRDAMVPINTNNMPAHAIAAGIPNGIMVNSVAVDRMDLSTIYAGTSKGVYRGRTNDGGISWSWEFYNTGIPAGVDIKDLEVHPTTGVIRAATMGRGAYELHPGKRIGTEVATFGKITSIRIHEVGTKYGPPNDQLDADVIVLVDNIPNMVLGFQLRKGPNAGQQRAMLRMLREAFNKGRGVRIDYLRTGFRVGIIQRVIVIQ